MNCLHVDSSKPLEHSSPSSSASLEIKLCYSELMKNEDGSKALVWRLGVNGTVMPCGTK
uniref:Uncharacterized protein n=1 Tax=Oryza sativa subsp. japonica TaxID=39947 RepID=Q6ZHS2_ORYSJ|nr:hypothetical protein [Oryza sativa Japonica Group]